MYKIKFVIILLFLVLIYKNKTENFSDSEIKSKSRDIYNYKDIFTPGVNYKKVKKKIKWIDPIVYNDVYKLSLTENLSISNLEKTLYNSIQII